MTLEQKAAAAACKGAPTPASRSSKARSTDAATTPYQAALDDLHALNKARSEAIAAVSAKYAARIAAAHAKLGTLLGV